MKIFYLSHRLFVQILRQKLNLALTLFTTPFVILIFWFSVEGTGAEIGSIGFTDFVPGILVLSIIMMIFSTSMIITEELESGGIFRLRMAGFTTVDVLLGLSIPSFVLGCLGLFLSMLVSYFLGMEFYGIGQSLPVLAIGLISHITVGIFIGSIARNRMSSFLFASLAMFILLILSGVFFPKPRIEIVLYLDIPIDILNILPSYTIRSVFQSLSGQAIPPNNNFFLSEIFILLVISGFYLLMGTLFFTRTERKILEGFSL